MDTEAEAPAYHSCELGNREEMSVEAIAHLAWMLVDKAAEQGHPFREPALSIYVEHFGDRYADDRRDPPMPIWKLVVSEATDPMSPRPKVKLMPNRPMPEELRGIRG